MAFHIRRTDKLISESKLYHANEYVKKLLDVTPALNTTDFHHCYVATDDENALAEMKEALANAKMTCGVHSLSSGELKVRTRSVPLETVRFMTDLSIRY